MLGYVLDDLFGETGHRAPAGHPERPARFDAVRDALGAAGLGTLGTRVPIRPATDEELVRAHAPAYLEELARKLPGNSGWLDGDTYYSPRTFEAALAAAGSAAQLAMDVLDGRFTRGLAVVRPPGHHATRDQGMGFCLINNIAVAAAAVRARGAARVAIVDWDVHHGNGTQDIFWDDPSVLFLSMHQYPYYPGSGAPTELGGERARGATVNVGLPRGSGDADYAAVLDHVFAPAITAFRPDVILVSAGFDAFEHDPLAGMRVTHAGFAQMARRLRSLADATTHGRLVALLEGGYDLEGLAGGMTAVLTALTMPNPAAHPIAPMPENPIVRAAIEGTRAAHAAAGHPIAAAGGAS